MHNLYERLKQQKEAKSAASRPDSGPSGVSVVDAASVSDARREPRPGRRPAVRLSPPWEQVAGEVWRAVYRSAAPAAAVVRRCASIGGLLVGPETDPEGLCFLDSETTGLSGGAGTTAFLLASARLQAEELETTLLFLSDFSGEPVFLQLVREQLLRAQTLVTYNGRAFDVAILRNRFLLNRIEPVERQHIDLLHPARRLFGTVLERCSLSVVEREILGITRQADIDGAAVPDAWLRFIRTGDSARIQPVFSHVLQDSASLLQLLARIELLAADEDGNGNVDPLQRARLLIESPYRVAGSLSLRQRGLSSLEALACVPDHPQSATAARYYCALQRRRGNWGAAQRVWLLHFERRRSLWAAVELAKYHEHRRRDLAAAADIVERAAGWDHARAVQAELVRRRQRIERKLLRSLVKTRAAGKTGPYDGV
ncbi:MAG: hypothetical protein EA384_04890 [Spirochaetaceae bacterium]|nr:MAG: hypothetical protein EA384_04890 [Spirochaetaceae bacterium]